MMLAANYISFSNAAQKGSYIMTGIYLTSFLQYGWLWIIILFDYRQVNWLKLKLLHESIYTDFNAAWF
jgi:hypothetical protein